MHYVKIEKGVVVNRVVFDKEMPGHWPDKEKFLASEEAQIGWTHDGRDFAAPPLDPEDTGESLRAQKQRAARQRVVSNYPDVAAALGWGPA